MDFDGRDFWIRFDVLLQKKGANIRELCANTGLMYSTINTQRTRHTIPKAEYLYEIACFLSVSMEELLIGKEMTHLSSIEAEAVYSDPALREIVAYLMDYRSRIDSLMKLFNLETEKRNTNRLA